jgi:hypothetical protein
MRTAIILSLPCAQVNRETDRGHDMTWIISWQFIGRLSSASTRAAASRALVRAGFVPEDLARLARLPVPCSSGFGVSVVTSGAYG